MRILTHPGRSPGQKRPAERPSGAVVFNRVGASTPVFDGWTEGPTDLVLCDLVVVCAFVQQDAAVMFAKNGIVGNRVSAAGEVKLPGVLSEVRTDTHTEMRVAVAAPAVVVLDGVVVRVGDSPVDNNAIARIPGDEVSRTGCGAANRIVMRTRY